MKPSMVVASFMAFAPVCKANFDVYLNRLYNLGPGGSEGHQAWTIFDSDPSCQQVNNAITYGHYGDVSGRQTGVRCVGDCAMEGRADGIQVLEMHFSNNPLYHWTIYKDRGYRMYGLDGKVYGECIIFPGNDYRCDALGITTGRRKIRCLTNFTARQINAAN
ncbi:hypothetical protein ColTof4_06667 [Colletotrichum tofieldiae]|uniref:Uncharacterized protein n=1 Tax=Colletotrichum tofieldiae TaxID=708197 RepID=A0A161YM58_9PEZI|nr:hypothetical protein CT0861_01810 [Colletotrichum tofieldiae]GKT64267.1 hypothetical protein ColTof3_11606 [Colletotrichum tofieldiae]GKT74244.1 hypothetical protein ColTof4_06667 [Colletotrichum tofieldiae]GKT97031.1 hypothetical protein Ct61P_14881 [Colletotrichum tofieldiae]